MSPNFLARGGLNPCSFRLGPDQMVVFAANVRLRWMSVTWSGIGKCAKHGRRCRPEAVQANLLPE
jgi:hypothetical protein